MVEEIQVVTASLLSAQADLVAWLHEDGALDGAPASLIGETDGARYSHICVQGKGDGF
jgi:hypothetical protein